MHADRATIVRLALGQEANCKDPDDGFTLLGTQSSHGEAAADRSPTATDCAATPEPATVASELGHANQRGHLLVVEPAALGNAAIKVPAVWAPTPGMLLSCSYRLRQSSLDSGSWMMALSIRFRTLLRTSVDWAFSQRFFSATL